MKCSLMTVLCLGLLLRSGTLAKELDLRVATLEVPPGFTETVTGTKDSRRGEISREKPPLVVGYDIGMMSGLHLHPEKQVSCAWFKDLIIAGQRYYVGLATMGGDRRLVVSIVPPGGIGQATDPWTYPANFWAMVKTEEDIADVMLMALSYSPRIGRGHKSPAVSEPPPPPRGALPPETSVPRYQSKNDTRASRIQPWREIRDLPATLAGDLAMLARRPAVAAKVAPDLDTTGLLVKCYSGISHTQHGLRENGTAEFVSRPGPGVYFTEHCFDRDGNLLKSIENRGDGTRFVSRTFLYDGRRPAGMLTFGPDGHAFSDVGLYRDGRLCLTARLDPAGNVMCCECLFYAGDREDYSVRYVARPTGAKFTVADLVLDEIHLQGSARLEFKDTGELKGLWLEYPREDSTKRSPTPPEADAHQ